MNLLAAKLYDPTPVVTFGTVASVLAVFDTTNLRISFTVPASGYVRVVIECTLHGATTYSQILLGCLEGATVRGRVAPRVTQSGTALATTMLRARADYNLDCDKKGRRGGNWGKGPAKLALEDVKAIRLSSDSNVALSKRYNVRHTTISAIRLFQTWKTV